MDLLHLPYSVLNTCFTRNPDTRLCLKLFNFYGNFSVLMIEWELVKHVSFFFSNILVGLPPKECVLRYLYQIHQGLFGNWAQFPKTAHNEFMCYSIMIFEAQTYFESVQNKQWTACHGRHLCSNLSCIVTCIVTDSPRLAAVESNPIITWFLLPVYSSDTVTLHVYDTPNLWWLWCCTVTDKSG